MQKRTQQAIAPLHFPLDCHPRLHDLTAMADATKAIPNSQQHFQCIFMMLRAINDFQPLMTELTHPSQFLFPGQVLKIVAHGGLHPGGGKLLFQYVLTLGNKKPFRLIVWSGFVCLSVLFEIPSSKVVFPEATAKLNNGILTKGWGNSMATSPPSFDRRKFFCLMLDK